MTQHIEIRPIRPEEFFAEAALVHAAYQASPYGPELAENDEWLAFERNTAARDAAGCVLVAAERSQGVDQRASATRAKILGSATVLPGGAPGAKIADQGEVELRMIAVDPHARGCGIGAALVRAGLELALRWGVSCVRLDTGARNPAQHLYSSLGFVRTPDRDARAAGGYGAALSYEYALSYADGVRVREIHAHEATAVGELALRAYRDDYPQLGADYLAEIAAVGERAVDYLVWVAEDAATGAILGTVTTPRPGQRMSSVAAEGEMDVRFLAVAHEARGKNVGERLMRHTIQLAEIRGIRRVVLNTSSEMPRAQRLYERLGFARMPERECEIAPPNRVPFTLLAYGIDVDGGVSSPRPDC